MEVITLKEYANICLSCPYPDCIPYCRRLAGYKVRNDERDFNETRRNNNAKEESN